MMGLKQQPSLRHEELCGFSEGPARSLEVGIGGKRSQQVLRGSAAPALCVDALCVMINPLMIFAYSLLVFL
jgi:hypothetical protein